MVEWIGWVFVLALPVVGLSWLWQRERRQRQYWQVRCQGEESDRERIAAALRRQAQRTVALLELPVLSEQKDEAAFLQAAVDQTEWLTESPVGFIRVLPDETCEPESMWAEVLRTRVPLTVNDPARAASQPGWPEGQAPLTRFVCVPILDAGVVKMLIGVGNRANDYTVDDVETLELMGNETWRTVQRRRSEGALHAALQVVTASPVVCFRWRASPGWPVAFVSDNVRQWGYEAAELLAGRPSFAEMVHPDDLPRVVDEVVHYVDTGVDQYEQEYRMVTRENQVIWVVDRTNVLRGKAGEVCYFDGVLTDITERKARQLELAESLARQRHLNKRLEEANNQLLQSEKLASIGQLAAGVAHELNNPIGFVHSNLGTLDGYLNDLMALIDAYAKLIEAQQPALPGMEALLRQRQDIDFDYLRRDIFDLVGESKEGLLRVKKIVQDLKSFSRMGEQDWQLADVHQGLESTLNIVWNELKYKCQVVRDYAELPPVYCVISQLNQVFMNLLLNAAQAIEKQGVITVRTSCPDSGHVRIEVADTGVGIPKAHMTRIFEPFFTTKPVGKGTGLGLSLSYGIIERHHGRIDVESTEGVGTTFRLTLPLMQPDTMSPPPDQESVA